MAEEALRALAGSVKGHGPAERSRSGSQRLKGSLRALPGILGSSQQRLGRDRSRPPVPGFRCSALPSPICFQNLLDGGTGLFPGSPRAFLPHSPEGAATSSKHTETLPELLLQAERRQVGPPGGKNTGQDSRLLISEGSRFQQHPAAVGHLWPQLGHGRVPAHPSHAYL